MKNKQSAEPDERVGLLELLTRGARCNQALIETTATPLYTMGWITHRQRFLSSSPSLRNQVTQDIPGVSTKHPPPSAPSEPPSSAPSPPEPHHHPHHHLHHHQNHHHNHHHQHHYHRNHHHHPHPNHHHHQHHQLKHSYLREVQIEQTQREEL